MIKLIGQEINSNFFKAFMKNVFCESFAHCSLSFEKEFDESRKQLENLKKFISPENIKYVEYLKQSGNQELLNQRYNEVIQVLKYHKIPEEEFINEDGETIPGINNFAEYIIGAIRPYRNTQELELAKTKNELTGETYETETLFAKASELATIIITKVMADTKARKLKKGNNDAFLYAIDLPKITISDIIEINYMINNDVGIKKGFKTANNIIGESGVQTCPKELIPTKIQELIYKYNHEWKEELPEYNSGDSESKKDEYLRAICIREAKYHIEFTKIHPFEDGNGRTGRIILNKHLIDNELGPILITNEMRSLYIKYLREEDTEKLGELIYMLTSTITPLIFSEYRKAKKIGTDELEMDLQLKKMN